MIKNITFEKNTLSQSLNQFEFLIVDDGSTDNSGDIISEYGVRDSRIRCVRQENRGLIDTLNRGLRLASHPLVARMDADDISKPDRLSRQLKFMLDHDDVAVVGCQIRRLLPDGSLTEPSNLPESVDSDDPQVVHPTAMMRRDAILALGGYRPFFTHAEDADLWFRVSERWKMANIDYDGYVYRMHDTQISKTWQVDQNRKTIYARWARDLRRATGKDMFDELSSSNSDRANFEILKRTAGTRRGAPTVSQLRCDLLHSTYANVSECGSTIEIIRTIVDIFRFTRRPFYYLEEISFHLGRRYNRTRAPINSHTALYIFLRTCIFISKTLAPPSEKF